MRPIGSWGRLSAPLHDLVHLHDPAHVAMQLASARRPGLPYGMGRSYGDSCLNPDGVLWLTRGLDHLMAFDNATGRLVCEAGVLLRDIQRWAMPRGWHLPVTPGTQWVTVGGAIANDVHGKNQHRCGTFGDHVRHIRLARTDGRLLECGPHLHPDWFHATVGGLGLTGVIVTTELQLQRVAGPWLDTETIPFSGLQAYVQLADEAQRDWDHCVAWLDCMAHPQPRGPFLRARPASEQDRQPKRSRQWRVPVTPPVSIVNRWTLRPLNAAYYHRGRGRSGRAVTHHESFHYPLDGLLEWNRLYGPAGFFQYQCVLPGQAAPFALQDLLHAIARSGEGSVLAVLKRFATRPAAGLLSFVQPGISLALDFPHRGQSTLRLLERLDTIVAQAGGRLYAAKDARMPSALFKAGYSELGRFLPFRDPGIRSGLSQRLLES